MISLRDWADDYLRNYAGERGLDPDDWDSGRAEDAEIIEDWIEDNADGMAQMMRRAVEAYMMDIDPIPGED